MANFQWWSVYAEKIVWLWNVFQEEDILVHTFNQTVTILEEDETEIGSELDVSYNYDECNNIWLEGQTGWEAHEIVCKAQYGSPAPNIRYWNF